MRQVQCTPSRITFRRITETSRFLFFFCTDVSIILIANDYSKIHFQNIKCDMTKGNESDVRNVDLNYKVEEVTNS